MIELDERVSCTLLHISNMRWLSSDHLPLPKPGVLQCFFKSTSILRRTPDPYLSSFAIPPHQSFPRFGHFLQLPFEPDRIVVWILHYNCTVSPSRYLLPSGSTSVSLLLGRLARSCDFLRHRQRQRAKCLATDRPTSRSGPDIRRKEGYFSFPFRNQAFSSPQHPVSSWEETFAPCTSTSICRGDYRLGLVVSRIFNIHHRPRRSYRNQDKCDQDDLDNEAFHRRPRLAYRGGHSAPEV